MVQNINVYLAQFISDIVRSALPLLVSSGVVGLIEPINPWSVHNYNMDSFQDGLDLVKKLNHPNIKLQLDLFHLQQLEGNLSRNIEKYLPYVGHIQIAQASERSFNILLKYIHICCRFHQGESRTRRGRLTTSTFLRC